MLSLNLLNLFRAAEDGLLDDLYSGRLIASTRLNCGISHMNVLFGWNLIWSTRR